MKMQDYKENPDKISKTLNVDQNTLVDMLATNPHPYASQSG
jgi:hypothetical protein